MIKIIFLFLMVLTVYENSNVLANDIERADEFIKFLDSYRFMTNQIAQRITLRKDSKEGQLKKLFARLTSNKVDSVVMLSSVAIDVGYKASSIGKYLKEVSIASQMNTTLKLISDVYIDNVNYFGVLNARKGMDEKKLKAKSIKKDTDKILRKEKTVNRLKDISEAIMKSELLDKIIESTKNFNEKELCGMQGSPQEVIYNFYIMCLSLELLTTTTMINGNAIYKIIDPDNGYEKKLNDHILQSKIRIKKYSSKFLSKIEQFPKNYRNCDPFDKDKHVRDVTYTEMSGLYQRILLFPYKMLNDDGCLSCEMVNFTNGTDVKECYSNLSTSTPWDVNGAPKDLDLCTTPRNCAGTVSRCRVLKEPKFCVLTDNSRRYQYLRDRYAEIDENRFGERAPCMGLSHDFVEVTSPSGDLCQYCLCTCGDESPNSLAVNTVSLLPSLSDFAKNRVVIGARIIVQNNILHLQVREAKIDKNYKIAKDGPDRWIKINDIQDAVRESRLESNMSKLNEFKDYIAWKENSTGFNFDEIPLDYGRVVTGLKFGMSKMEEEDENINKIQIEVQSMEYNHETGQLKKDSEKWHRPNSKHPNFLKIGTRVSTRTIEKTIIDSNTDQWANLQVSHDRSDAGQTTVPLFDAQTVESINKGPLCGIGLHHRSSNDKYSGFFALTGYSIDYYQFLKETNKNLN